MGGCAARERLEDLLHGRVDGPSQAALESHVDGCTACQETLERLIVDLGPGRAPLPLSQPSGEDAAFLSRLKGQGPPGEDLVRRNARPPSAGVPKGGLRRPRRVGWGIPAISGFEIVREVGRGGMGVVYEAIELALGRRVALKVLAAHSAAHPTAVERFRREAKAAGGLHHTNIVPIFGVGEDNGQLYYAMQFIEGESLDRVLSRLTPHQLSETARRSWAGGQAGETKAVSMPAADAAAGRDSSGLALAAASTQAESPCTPVWPTAPAPVAVSDPCASSFDPSSGDQYARAVARLGLQVAEALDHAHRHGVLHRDIKPSNLLIDVRGTPWITDFGLAKALESAADGLTRTGDIVGTMRYMAPERFAGRSDARADVYALGATLYELLTLRPLFEEKDQARLVERVLHETPVPPRRFLGRLPRDLETIVLKALAKEPEARYPTAAAMAEDLRRFLAGETLLARRASAPERAVRWCRRNPLLASLATAFGLALVGGLVASLSFGLHARNEAKRARIAGYSALEAQRNAEAERARATRERDRAESALYYSRIGLAERAWEANDIATARQLLEKCVPEPGQPDRRGWEWRYLHGVCHAERLVLRDSRYNTLSNPVYSPDGRWLITGSWELGSDLGEVVVRDAATGGSVHKLPVRGQWFSLALSRDGRLLGASSNGRVVTAWDATTWQAVDPGTFTAAGDDRNASGRIEIEGQIIAIFDPQSGAELRRLHGHVGQIYSARYAPDGALIASGGLDQTVRLWDSRDGSLLDVFRGHSNMVRAVAFSPDGTRLATAGVDQTIRVWDLTRSPRGLVVHKLLEDQPENSGLGEFDRLMHFGSDGTIVQARFAHIPSNEQPPRILRIDARAGVRTGVSVLVPARHARGLFWGTSRDARRLAVPLATPGGGIALIDLQTGREIRRLDAVRGATNLAEFSTDGRRLASVSASDDSVTLWDTATGAELQTIGRTGLEPSLIAERLEAQFASLRALVGESSAHALLALRYAGDPCLRVTFVDRALTHARQSVALDPEEPWLRGVLGVALLAEGRWREAITEVEASGRTADADSEPIGELVRAIGLWHQGDRTVARTWFDRAARSMGQVTEWNDVGRVLNRLRGEAEELLQVDGSRPLRPPSRATGSVMPPVSSLAFNPDGALLATGHRYGPGVLLWDIERGSLERVLLPESDGAISCVAFRPDGTVLAAVDASTGKIRAIRVATGEPVFTVTGPMFAEWVAFSPDGRRLAAAGRRGHVHVWDAENGQEAIILQRSVQQPPGTYGFRARVDFSPDGSLIAANDWSGDIEVWEANAASFVGRDAAQATDRARAFGWHIEQAWRSLGTVPASADFHLEKIRDEAPPGTASLIAQAELERRRDRRAIADSMFTRWLDQHPDDVEVLLRRADLSARTGRWSRAIDDLAKASAREPDDERAWLLGAAALIRVGDGDGYRRYCRHILLQFGAATGHFAHDAALACLLSPEAGPDQPAFTELVARCAAPPPGDPRLATWGLAISILADIRAGRSASVVARWPTGLGRISTHNDTHLQLLIPCLEALACARAAPPGRDRARQLLEQTAASVDRQRDIANGDSAAWWIWLSCDALRREIERSIADVSFPEDPFVPDARNDP